MEDRPLAKKQEALQVAFDETRSSDEGKTEEGSATEVKAKAEVASSTSSKTDKVVRKALLKNDDYELERVGKVSNIEFAFVQPPTYVPSCLMKCTGASLLHTKHGPSTAQSANWALGEIP